MLKGFFSRRGRPLEWDWEMVQSKRKVRMQQVRNASVVVKERESGDEVQPEFTRTN